MNLTILHGNSLPLCGTEGGFFFFQVPFTRILPLSCLLFFLLLLPLFLRAAPAAYGSSQARGHIRAAAADLHHSYSSARSDCL